MKPTAFRSAAGVVDRLQGEPLPETINLFAIATTAPPNPDGNGFLPKDVASAAPTPVTFHLIRDELRNPDPVCIHLLEGPWPRLYLQLTDEMGEPYAKGEMALSGVGRHYIEARAEKLTIVSRH